MMENPISSPDSQTESQNEPATDNTSQGLSEELNEPQTISEPAEENNAQNLDQPPEDSVPEDLNERKLSKPLIVVEPPVDSRHGSLNEQALVNELQNQPSQDHGLQDLNEPHEESKTSDPENTAQDLENEAEAQGDVPYKTSLDRFDSLLRSTSGVKGQEMTVTDGVTTPKPSFDNIARGLSGLAVDHQPQSLRAPSKIFMAGPPHRTVDKKKSSRMHEKTSKTGKGEAAPSPNKRCSHACGHCSLSSRPMFSWSPSQLAKATFCPKPKPQTADKTTQILPGRVPMFTRFPPKTVLPPKPKPPSADKATQISPSFIKLVKPPPPLMMKKKKEEISPMPVTKRSPRLTSSSSKIQSFSNHRGRPPRVTSSSRTLRVKRSRSRQLRAKSSKSKPLPVKRSRSGPLRVKLSSTSPSKHRLNLSVGSSNKRQIVCNLYLTFCDNWDEPKPCCLQESRCEEHLFSCSGLYRACSVFSMIKYGRIHICNLLLALHTLGILVTSEEMHHILHLTHVDEHQSLNFCEFLEAVNTTSPFAETEAFKNTLQAFRKMKHGTMTTKELEPVLLYLGIILSPETVLQSLGRTKVNKNGKFDISDFLMAAKDLHRALQEEDEAFLNDCVFKGRSYQDVADLVDIECRRRRKYCNCFEEETPILTCHRPFCTWHASSEEDFSLGKSQSTTSSLDIRRSKTSIPITFTKEEAKEGDVMEVTTSQMGFSSDLKSSSPESIINNAKGGNKDKNAVELGKS